MGIGNYKIILLKVKPASRGQRRLYLNDTCLKGVKDFLCVHLDSYSSLKLRFLRAMKYEW